MSHTRTVCLLLAACVVAAALDGCAPSTAAKRDKPDAVPVTVVTAAVVTRPQRVEALGTVEPSDSVAVKSRVDGQIKLVLFQEGDRVTAGQTLYQLDDAMVRAQIAATAAQQQRDAATARQTEAEYKRVRELSAKGFASASMLDQARATAESAVAAAKSDAAQVDVLTTQLAYYKIAAPIAGRTGESVVKPGADVKANDTTALVTINQLSPVRVRFSIPPALIAMAHANASDAAVAAHLHGQAGAALSGRLVFLDNTVDATSGELLAKGAFDNADERLWPGALVDVELRMGVVANLVALPESAVQLGDDGTFVFVANKNGMAERRAVNVFDRDGGQVFVAKGVAAGDRVVVDGAVNLEQGAKVVVAAAASPKAMP